jgi:protein-arginine kinase activator protein McsA
MTLEEEIKELKREAEKCFTNGEYEKHLEVLNKIRVLKEKGVNNEMP